MKKRISSLIFVFVLIFCAVMPAFADDTVGFSDEYYRLSDGAGLLTEDEDKNLLDKLDEISARQKMDIVIVTSEDLGGRSTSTEYADDIYDDCNFGYGEERDGVLLLVSMADRDWAISTCGYARTTVFTDDGIDYIGEQIKPYLSDGKYADAFNTFAELCDDFITQAKNGKSFDKSNLPREPLSLIWIPVSIAAGVISALIIVGIMKGKLKTVRFRTDANSYVKKDSLNISDSSDLFLYHTVTRTERPKDDNPETGSHTSSSGTTHGGGSGKF